MADSPNTAIARAWLEAFNRGDVDALVHLYAKDAVHTSPKLRAADPNGDGSIRGRDALHRWWTDSHARLPGLRYEALAIVADEKRVVLEYMRFAPNQPPMPVAEIFDVENGLIVRSRAFHGA